MSHSVRLVLVLHNHQPVGNFEHVFEQAYRDAYLPFLDVFERYPSLKLALHTSGPLVEWLEARHPEYLDRLAALAAAGRVEILGGAFYEPILTMIPSRDRLGQIRSFTRWLEARLAVRVRGMWIPERVWEQSLVADLASSGIEYTLLDDFHFKNAGLVEDRLHGYYMTEDAGRLLAVFPDSEPLRYAIPFADPHRSIDYLRHVADTQPGAVVLFGDDGEKLGAWPETHRTCYEERWLARFFDLVGENQDWLQVALPGEVIDTTPPLGKIYLPEGSYREMTEWALPAEQLIEYVRARREMEHDSRWPRIARFVRGGFWRNFKVKYPETDEMYSRMHEISGRLEAAEAQGAGGERLDQARTALYRGQCNCAFWHGAFGGIYLPHLRNAIYSQLIAADSLLDPIEGKTGAWVEQTQADFNLDGRPEVRLANDRLVALVAPSQGGMLYGLDSRPIAHNLLATMTRRPEAYHQQILAGGAGPSDVAAVAANVVFKEADLGQRLQYDSYPRKSLLDHFYDLGAGLPAVIHGLATERGDLIGRPYEARLRAKEGRRQIQLAADGTVDGVAIRVNKAISLDAGSSTLEIAYLLEGVPPDHPLHFAVEFNFAGLPAGADDRWFGQGRQRLGQLGVRLDLADQRELSLHDEWLGIAVQLEFSRATGIWTYPIESVNQSEGGFEAVHQSVVVLPHWIVEADSDGRWGGSILLTLDTSQAESRQPRQALATC